MPNMKMITEEQYRLLVTAAAQTDYACHHGDSNCMKAAAQHAAQALVAIGEKTAAQEEKEEEDE
jgi:hypothetical protein